MNSRRQALRFCLDPAVVAAVEKIDQLLTEVIDGMEDMEVFLIFVDHPAVVLQMDYPAMDRWVTRTKDTRTMPYRKGTA